ncbi:MAG: GTPase RsgA, partial [Clostridia bacterium]|nr:GTPase RsgA [Clostridia bacterium]
GAGLEVGSLSEKTERGRHTTRHTELIPLPSGGAVLDTPGFSLLDALELEPEEIRLLYPELRGEEEHCRFSGCLHVTEPGCRVKKELIIDKNTGKTKGIHRERYERYVRLVNEAAEHRRHKYD